MGFYIKGREVEDLWLAIQTLKSDLSKALETNNDSVINSINGFQNLPGFEGETADSIRNYFQEKHAPLIDSLMIATELMEDEFTRFVSRMQSHPVGEKGYYVLNDECLHNAVYGGYGQISLQNTILNPLDLGDGIAQLLTKSQNEIAHASSTTAPDPGHVRDSANRTATRVNELRNGIAEVDAERAACFNNANTSFNKMTTMAKRLLGSLQSAPCNMESYQSGYFMKNAYPDGFEEVFDSCCTEIEKNRNDQALINADNTIAERWQERITEDAANNDDLMGFLQGTKWATVAGVGATSWGSASRGMSLKSFNKSALESTDDVKGDALKMDAKRGTTREDTEMESKELIIDTIENIEDLEQLYMLTDPDEIKKKSLEIIKNQLPLSDKAELGIDVAINFTPAGFVAAGMDSKIREVEEAREEIERQQAELDVFNSNKDAQRTFSRNAWIAA